MRDNRKSVRYFTYIIMTIIIISIAGVLLTRCGDATTTTITAENNSKEELKFIADFYDNHGSRWLSIEGTSFNISPNKIKEYYYNDSGHWTYRYALSSVMSVDIDGNSIENCGSTIIFSDSRLVKMDIDLPKVVTSSESNSASIQTPKDLPTSDYFSLGFWWKTSKLNNKDIGAKIVVVQSQEGDAIGMYAGNEVSWTIPSNLPKTTKIIIDGMPLFIHRANFAIIDTSLLNKVVE